MTNQSSNARMFTRKLRQSSFCNENQTFAHKLEMKRTSSTCESIINYVVITNCLLFLVFYYYRLLVSNLSSILKIIMLIVISAEKIIIIINRETSKTNFRLSFYSGVKTTRKEKKIVNKKNY